jgi:hypothetical protein
MPHNPEVHEDGTSDFNAESFLCIGDELIRMGNEIKEHVMRIGDVDSYEFLRVVGPLLQDICNWTGANSDACRKAYFITALQNALNQQIADRERAERAAQN